jgi:hypothetical protein
MLVAYQKAKHLWQKKITTLIDYNALEGDFTSSLSPLKKAASSEIY